MARLIDADAAKIRFANYREDCINEDDINAADVFADVVSELDEFPTIDPVTAAAEALGMSPDRLRELAQAEKEGRLVVLEHAAKKGEKKPPCFYNDMGQEFCLGLARGECDDEPIDRCKECWYCESTREAAEAALEEREAEHDT